MKQTICLAGKNAIVVNAMQYLIENVDHSIYTLIGCLNKSDNGENNWQPSFSFFCKKNNIPLLSLEDCYEVQDLLFISLEFDRIIKPAKFSSSRLFNIHFSKLPEYKGMYTSVLPLLHGRSHSGVTLHRIDKGIDTGEIIDQRIFPLNINYNSFDLYQQYLKESFELFLKNIDSLIQGKEVSAEQAFAGSSYFSKASITFSDIKIDYNKTAFEIHNQIRAFCFREYQLPFFFENIIYKSEIIPKPTEGKPGTILYQNEWYIIINSIDYQVKLYIDKLDLLLEAAGKGDVKGYEEIKNNGFPATTRNKKGWDALIVACYNNQTGFVQELLKNGWNVNSKNYNETTAAMYAMTASGMHNELSILQTIASYSPDWKSLDKQGKDIFQYAREYNNASVITFLSSFAI